MSILYSNLGQRLITAVMLLAVAVGTLFLLPNWAMATVFAALWLAGAWEWAALAEQPKRRWWMVSAIAVLLVLAIQLPPSQANLMFWLALVWWLTATVWLFRFPTPIPLAAAVSSGVLVLVPSWLALVTLHQVPKIGPWLVLSVLLVVWCADVGAYFAGRTLGRTPLAPRVSPKKTWEGVAGGLLTVAAVSWVIAPLLGLARPLFLLVAVITAMASVVGDLTVSMFKRNAGLKDSGVLFPGHGGVMDRVDSISSASPVFCLTLTALTPLGL